MISVEHKQEFIRWFLKEYEFKRRECSWIMHYLLNHSDVLDNTHFTEEVHLCTRAMVMSTTESDSIPFRFYNGNVMTADADKAFTALRMEPTLPLYIQLNFEYKNSFGLYTSICIDNPYRLDHNPEDRRTAEELLDHVSKDIHLTVLRVQIDQALDNNDKELFMKLSSTLKEVMMDGTPLSSNAVGV